MNQKINCNGSFFARGDDGCFYRIWMEETVLHEGRDNEGKEILTTVRKNWCTRNDDGSKEFDVHPHGTGQYALERSNRRVRLNPVAP